MSECKHKWKRKRWDADGCGCHGILKAVCLLCDETFHEYVYCFDPVMESCEQTEKEGFK